jgi:hypothetical protein
VLKESLFSLWLGGERPRHSHLLKRRDAAVRGGNPIGHRFLRPNWCHDGKAAEQRRKKLFQHQRRVIDRFRAIGKRNCRIDRPASAAELFAFFLLHPEGVGRSLVIKRVVGEED